MEGGIATVRPRTGNASRVVTVIAVVVPPLGLLSAVGLLWGVAVRPLGLVLLGGFYGLGAVGITVGFHRLFAHRSLDRGQLDLAWLVIRGLERLGLAWNVRRPEPRRLAARRI